MSNCFDNCQHNRCYHLNCISDIKPDDCCRPFKCKRLKKIPIQKFMDALKDQPDVQNMILADKEIRTNYDTLICFNNEVWWELIDLLRLYEFTFTPSEFNYNPQLNLYSTSQTFNE